MSRTNYTKGGIWNVQGLQRKYPEVQRWMKTNKISWLITTETWLGEEANDFQRPWDCDENLVSLVPGKKDKSKAGRSHRGLALIINNQTDLKRQHVKVLHTGESRLWCIWSIREVIVVGIYLPPSLTMEEYQDELRQAINTAKTLAETRMIILAGDFNANVKHRTFRGNVKGNFLIEETTNQGIQIIEPENEHFATTICRSGSSNRWKDIFFASQSHQDSIQSCHIDESMDWLSDHYPVSISYLHHDTIEHNTVDNNTQLIRWKWAALRDNHTIRERFVQTLDQKLHKFKALTVTTDIESITDKQDYIESNTMNW